MDRVAIKEDCDAELNPAPTDGIERILVPLPNVTGLSRLPEFVRGLCEESTREVTLFHVVEAEERVAAARRCSARVRPGQARRRDPPDGREYDAVVMYQAEPA